MSCIKARYVALAVGRLKCQEKTNRFSCIFVLFSPVSFDLKFRAAESFYSWKLNVVPNGTAQIAALQAKGVASKWPNVPSQRTSREYAAG